MDSTATPQRIPLWLVYALLLVAGALMVFTFAPYSVHWSLVFVLMIVLYQSVQSLTAKQGFWAGWFFGFGYFGLCVNWVYNSIHMFGSATAPLAGAVTLLFVLVMTLFPAICVWSFIRLKSRVAWPWRALLFASLWVLLELARGKIMGGFPWALLGYSQTTEWFGSLAPYVGVYGIGFLIVLLPNVLVDLVRYSSSQSAQAISVVAVLLISTAVWFGLHKLDQVELSEAKGTSLNVRLVQANIPQELKFSVERLQSSLEQYTRLSLESLPATDIIIWPETAIPTYFARIEDYIEPFAQGLHDQGTEVLAGGFYRDETHSYNAIRQLAGEKALYQKRHLVPFGEYMPFRFMLGWLKSFVEIPMSDLGKGSGPNVPMILKNESLGLSICYEDVFGEEMRELIPAAGVLVNVSNDAWFGEKLAPYQHQQKAQMRARELVRPLIRVTNTGVSSVIDHKGRIEGSIAHNTQGYMDSTVYPRTGQSFYARTGNWPVFIFAMLVLALVLLQNLRTRNPKIK